VRAFAPKPGAYTRAGERRLKILESRVLEHTGSAGEVLAGGAEGIVVGCGSGALSIVQAQLEGRRVQNALELINGRAVSVGQRLA
jgi:methionyl-tRNA formyltransferase